MKEFKIIIIYANFMIAGKYLLIHEDTASNDGNSDRVIISAALLGLVNGITE